MRSLQITDIFVEKFLSSYFCCVLSCHYAVSNDKLYSMIGCTCETRQLCLTHMAWSRLIPDKPVSVSVFSVFCVKNNDNQGSQLFWIYWYSWNFKIVLKSEIFLKF